MDVMSPVPVDVLWALGTHTKKQGHAPFTPPLHPSLKELSFSLPFRVSPGDIC